MCALIFYLPVNIPVNLFPIPILTNDRMKCVCRSVGLLKAVHGLWLCANSIDCMYTNMTLNSDSPQMMVYDEIIFLFFSVNVWTTL